MAGITSTYDDITNALQQMQSDRADTIGVPKVISFKRRITFFFQLSIYKNMSFLCCNRCRKEYLLFGF